MRPLVINSDVRAAIAKMIEYARANVVSVEVVEAIGIDDPTSELNLEDRRPGSRPTASVAMEIPMGFHVALCFEQQPIGLCRHLSISVATSAEGKIPNMEATKMIAKEFGFIDSQPRRVWVEEFAPGERAVNLVQVEPKPN